MASLQSGSRLGKRFRRGSSHALERPRRERVVELDPRAGRIDLVEEGFLCSWPSLAPMLFEYLDHAPEEPRAGQQVVDMDQCYAVSDIEVPFVCQFRSM
jgi:hypothetical protein